MPDARRTSDLDPGVGHEQAGQRRALVVSYEAFHASGMAAVCPVSARAPKYPGEVPVRQGHAGQTKDAVILCHQVRTIDLSRVTAMNVAGRTQYATDVRVRRDVRLASHATLGSTSRRQLTAPTEHGSVSLIRAPASARSSQRSEDHARGVAIQRIARLRSRHYADAVDSPDRISR
jgi:mRNA-degrading endonuclease toxin of MazEF toxin-antitoxin module